MRRPTSSSTLESVGLFLDRPFVGRRSAMRSQLSDLLEQAVSGLSFFSRRYLRIGTLLVAFRADRRRWRRGWSRGRGYIPSVHSFLPSVALNTIHLYTIARK